MALTIAIIKRNVVGNQREAIADVTFDNAYPAGGEAFTPNDLDKDFGTATAFHYVALHMNDATVADQRFTDYDYTNKKLMLKTAVNTEATGDQSAVKIRVLARYGGATG